MLNCEQLSKDVNFEVLRGLTNALLAAGKPDEVSYSIIEITGSQYVKVNKNKNQTHLLLKTWVLKSLLFLDFFICLNSIYANFLFKVNSLDSLSLMNYTVFQRFEFIEIFYLIDR